jgi:futalosine hydrolase
VPNVLIVSATVLEITPVLKHYNFQFENKKEGVNTIHNHLAFLITGVGMVNTAYHLGRIQQNFEVIVNLGICGAFNRDLKLGEAVNITQDTLSEMGAEDGDNFIKYNDLNLGGKNIYESWLDPEFPVIPLKKVKGITVNKVHGNDDSILKTQLLFSPDVESMEGAAFFRGCEGLSTNVLQIRAISNYVEKRDRSKWDIPLAVKNLNNSAIDLLKLL